MVLDDVWKRNQELEFGVSDDDWYELKVVLRFQSCFLFQFSFVTNMLQK